MKSFELRFEGIEKDLIQYLLIVMVETQFLEMNAEDIDDIVIRIPQCNGIIILKPKTTFKKQRYRSIFN